MEAWRNFLDALSSSLSELSFRDDGGTELGISEGFSRWIALAIRIRRERSTIFFVGNGASSSLASHFAADVGKNAQVSTQVLTDPALLTAIANDTCFSQIFADPLRRRMRQGDLLVAISSSGNSPNIVEAVRAAREGGGMVITISAMRPDNAIRSMGDLNAYIPAPTYGLAETGHAAILHQWTDLLLTEVQGIV